jgi:hypothetical protein
MPNQFATDITPHPRPGSRVSSARGAHTVRHDQGCPFFPCDAQWRRTVGVHTSLVEFVTSVSISMRHSCQR